MSQPLIIGHRGAAAVAPENTRAAFALALADGADGFEFDVRLARDGIPVVIHDATLRRTALRDGEVARMSSAELQQVDVGTWFNVRYPHLARSEFADSRVLTLAEVLEVFSGSCRALYVEIKCDLDDAHAHAAEVVRTVRAHALVDRVVVESFTLDAIREVKRLAPEIRTAALFERRLARPFPSRRRIIAQAVACGADELALHFSLVAPGLIRAAIDAGLRTLVWTVDDPSWMKRATDLKLHALITNHPAVMRAASSGPLTD